MILLILAAGKGSRLPKKHRDKPKCLVKIKSKSLIQYNLPFFNHFQKKIIITGYKKKYLKDFIKKNNFKEIYNKNYSKTNMVYSMNLAKKYIKEDTVIVYGDVIFSKKILKILNEKGNIIPGNKNWLKNWIGRMGLRKTLNDAENFQQNKGKLSSIGEKINYNKLPDLQFMGLIKITPKTFNNLSNLFKKNKNLNLDFTSLINLSIKKIKIKYKIKSYSGLWLEIDSLQDIKYAKKVLK
jgi:choline kinase